VSDRSGVSDEVSTITQDRMPIAHRLAMHHPFLLPDLGGNLHEEVCLLQGQPALSAANVSSARGVSTHLPFLSLMHAFEQQLNVDQ